jgi:ubiquinone/menaquinone biosynthesis C-methylase UbiE
MAQVRRSIDRSIGGVTSLASTWFRVLAHHGPMRRAVDAREHLDGDLRDTATLDGNLVDLARINRLFGGTRLSIAALGRLVEAAGAGGGALRVIDVGTGAADIPVALATAPGPWSSVAVTAVDSRPEVLAAAERLNPSLASHPGVSLALADGRGLPWPDGAYDVGHASLVLHHLERREAVTFLAELGRVARFGVVVNDLARGRLTLFGARMLLPLLTGNPWTRHDGILSVRRAWTRREAEALLREAGLRPVGAAVGLAAHRWAIAAVPA